MALSGWNPNQKLKLTIDSSKIDEDLTNFPVNITLSSGTGQTGFDTTVVFDELSTISGTKNIAITDSDDNQLYVEIERWDWENEEANLWVKVPTIVSGTDTDLYLYYDATVSGNITYIGDIGDSAAQNVWDADFVGVWHMSQDPSIGGACILDSTSNTNNGTPGGSMTTDDSVNSVIGKGIDFDGLDDEINCGQDTSLDMSGSYTLEAIIEGYAPAANAVIIGRYDDGANDGFCFYYQTATNKLAYIHIDSGVYNFILTALGHTSGYHYLVSTFENGVGSELWRNGASEGTDTTQTSALDTFTQDFLIGAQDAVAPRNYTGEIDEIRLSKIIRPDEWIKATHYSNFNDLITFSVEELPVTFIFSNPVPTDLSKVYGITTQLYLTTTVTGEASDYVYDAIFYDAYDDSAIDTASGIQSGQPAGVVMSTLSGIDYQWYVTATSSGNEDTSDTYTFTNRFLCAGQTQINDAPASGIPVRLYRRSTGEYVGGTTSAGVSGTFEIESTFNEYHYAVALYDTDNTNAVIEDWLIPTASG